MTQQQLSQITMGSLIIVVGLLLLAGQLDISHAWHLGRLWPVIFLVIGASRLASSDRRTNWSAMWFLFLGGLFLLHTYRVMELSESWPLFVVWAGVAMMFRRRERNGSPPSRPTAGSPDGLRP